jgi:hypothetical protein
MAKKVRSPRKVVETVTGFTMWARPDGSIFGGGFIDPGPMGKAMLADAERQAVETVQASEVKRNAGAKGGERQADTYARARALLFEVLPAWRAERGRWPSAGEALAETARLAGLDGVAAPRERSTVAAWLKAWGKP